MDTVQVLKPATARMVFRWQMALLAVLLSVIAVCNAFTTIADEARGGVHLAAWEPGAPRRTQAQPRIRHPGG